MRSGRTRQTGDTPSSPGTAIVTWPQGPSTRSEETWESPGPISTRGKPSYPFHPFQSSAVQQTPGLLSRARNTHKSRKDVLQFSRSWTAGKRSADRLAGSVLATGSGLARIKAHIPTWAGAIPQGPQYRLIHPLLQPRHRIDTQSRPGQGPGGRGGGAAGADDRRPVEILQDAGAVHGAPGGRPGSRCQVLPGKRGLMLQEAADNVGSSPSRWAKRYCNTNL